MEGARSAGGSDGEPRRNDDTAFRLRQKLQWDCSKKLLGVVNRMVLLMCNLLTDL